MNDRFLLWGFVFFCYYNGVSFLAERGVLERQGTNKTSYEIWKGKKPNLSHFHVFGCTCYILNDREQLGKFQAKCDKSVCRHLILSRIIWIKCA